MGGFWDKVRDVATLGDAEGGGLDFRDLVPAPLDFDPKSYSPKVPTDMIAAAVRATRPYGFDEVATLAPGPGGSTEEKPDDLPERLAAALPPQVKPRSVPDWFLPNGVTPFYREAWGGFTLSGDGVTINALGSAADGSDSSNYLIEVTIPKDVYLYIEAFEPWLGKTVGPAILYGQTDSIEFVRLINAVIGFKSTTFDATMQTPSAYFRDTTTVRSLPSSTSGGNRLHDRTSRATGVFNRLMPLKILGNPNDGLYVQIQSIPEADRQPLGMTNSWEIDPLIAGARVFGYWIQADAYNRFVEWS